MTPAELRPLVNRADIYKMSLGKNARYRAEALEKGVLVFGSEKAFHQAVLSGDEAEIARTGRLIKSDQYPSAGAPRERVLRMAGFDRNLPVAPEKHLDRALGRGHRLPALGFDRGHFQPCPRGNR